jgi:putative ABC transport system permease protein
MPSGFGYARRSLLRSPAFTALAVLTVALGAGVNSAVFTIVNSVILKPLPYGSAERLVRLNEVRGASISSVSYPDFQDWQRRSRVFDEMAIYTALGLNPVKLPSGSFLLPTGSTSWNLFQVLGVRPFLGRAFLPADDLGDGADVTVISYQAWEKHFAKDPGIVGRQIGFFGTPLTIVGVLPEDVLPSSVDFWMPRGEVRNPNQLDRGSRGMFQVIGRLKRGVSLEQARVDLDAIAGLLSHEYPATNTGFSAAISPLLDSMVMHVRQMLWILFGAVAFIMLIACANVANLLLVRSLHREREFAIRAAVGASRMQSMSLVLCESLLVSAAGTIAGLVVAGWLVTVLIKLQPGVLPASRPVSIDAAVFWYTAFLTLVAAALFGLFPAWRAGRGNLAVLLKQGGRGGSGAAVTQRLRSLLLAGEVVLSIILLGGAGLMIRSLYALQHSQLGFSSEHLLTAQIMVPQSSAATEERLAQASYAYLNTIRALPGIDSAAAVWPLPENQDETWNPRVNFREQMFDPGAEPSVNAAVVTPEYFHTMGIPVLRGRVFDASDLNPVSSSVAIVNQAFARKFFPNQNVLGKHVRMAGVVGVKGWKEIIGVVADITVGGLTGHIVPQVYWPYGQIASREVGFVIRAGAPDAVAGSLPRVLAAVDANVIFEFARPISDLLAESVAGRRFVELLLSMFAALALTLASIGIYGLVGFSVARRTHEIGVRVALGASAANVFRLVLADTLVPVGAGVAGGLAAAMALSPLLTSQLYGVAPHDPTALSSAAILLAAVAACAAILPVSRALRISPLVAIREE